MADKKEEVNCSDDPCIWCCFPCIFTMVVCENCCKAICMFICCIQPDSVKPNNDLSIVSEGCIQGVEMTLSHDNDIEISLVDADCMHCYSASNQIDANTTKVLVVRAGAECVTDLGSIVGDYDISGLVMSNHEGQTIDSDWYEYSDFKVEIAGPNPFNPSTALNVVVPADGYVSVKIYNLIGQEVATLQDGYMDQNFSGYKLSWNASNLASGVYLVRSESAGAVSLNKLMLLK